jgi:hypothetical protein
MTWNICGEAGGPIPTPANPSPAYCPYRNQPQVKADAVAEVIGVRRLNAVILQEVCASARPAASSTCSSRSWDRHGSSPRRR